MLRAGAANYLSQTQESSAVKILRRRVPLRRLADGWFMPAMIELLRAQGYGDSRRAAHGCLAMRSSTVPITPLGEPSPLRLMALAIVSAVQPCCSNKLMRKFQCLRTALSLVLFSFVIPDENLAQSHPDKSQPSPLAQARMLEIERFSQTSVGKPRAAHGAPPQAMSQPTNQRCISVAACITTNEPAAGSTTRSPGLVRAPIRRLISPIGFACG